MKNVTRKALGFGMAAVMLTSGAAVPASAVGVEQQAVVSSAYADELGALAKPKIVKTKCGPAAVKLTWKKVDKASGYKVFMKTKDGWKCKAVVKGGSKLSAKVQGLNAKTEYAFKVQAYKKSKGKTYYSKFSAPVAVKTAYGVGTSNWENPYMSAKFNRNAWGLVDGDKEILSLFTKVDDERYDLYLQASRIPDGEVITTDMLVDYVIDQFAHYDCEFTRQPNVEIGGVKFAKVSGMIEYAVEGNYEVVNYYVKATGKKYFIFYEQYSENQDIYKKEIDEVWKTVSIK